MNILAIITKALEVAEERLKKNLGQQELHYKESSKDFATNTDLSIESSMSEYLKEVTPDIPIIGEEFSPIAPDNITNQSYWVIDPIDGTANFSRQIPLYGICLALMESGSAVACGIVFPELSEKYTAQLNSGAFLNGIKLSVSQCLTVSDSIAGFGDFSVGKGSEKKNRFRSELIHLLGNNTLRVRMLGSAAMQLAWLAAGRMDISVTLSNKAWDVQAGVLLVREAGGEVFDYNGEPHSFSSAYTLASSNPSLKQSLLNMLSACERNA